VAQAFADWGVPVLDADQVARDVVAPGTPGLAAVIAEFGEAYLSAEGALDRRALREHVFSDPAQRKRLEALLHPRIRDAMRHWRDQLQAPYGILMVPILIEGGFDSLCDRILVVDLPTQEQIHRLQQRDDISEELARNMLSAQATREQRLQRADDVIDNSGAPQAWASQVAQLHEQYLARAAQSADDPKAT
jgi:dephospho-CoA kinase